MALIDKVQVYSVVQQPPEYSWSPVMPEVLNTDTIVKITDKHGHVGVGGVCTFTEYGVDKSVLESIRPIANNLLRKQPSTPQEFWQAMQMRRPGVSYAAIAAIDIALWDLKAQQAHKPLFQYLGGTKVSIGSYASVPILDEPNAYIQLIHELRQTGFSIFKFHYKSIAVEDIKLIDAVSREHGNHCRFMFDAENLYDLEAACKVADAMADRDYIWLEAPFDDHDWSTYSHLKETARIPIIPAGNSVVDYAHLKQALTANCWDILRIDAATAGGITPALKIFELAKTNNVNVELQSWGSSLSTAANLHLALAHDNSQFFEVPVPRQDFNVLGSSNFIVNQDGYIDAPINNGIGLNVNWIEIERQASAYAEYK